MPKIQMEVVPEPKPNTASVFIRTDVKFVSANPYAAMGGEGDTDYICGACRVTLAAQMRRGQIRGMIFKCANCGTHNQVKGT